MSIEGLHQIPGIRVGHATDPVGLTGCTAIVFPRGAVAGHVAAGVATGSRELATLEPRHLVERVHGICLSGGSAFGLAAASGVARVLEEAGIGHQTSKAKVPIVAGAVVYDLALGDPRARPDEAMGAAAARLALAEGSPPGPRSGNVGAGTGVCAGKVLGIPCATKTGLGVQGLDGGAGLLIGALVVLNPVGDVLGPDGKLLAGARRAAGSNELCGTCALIREGRAVAPLTAATNTTLAVVGCNAAISRVEAAWLAEQAQVALARRIDPPFTRHDGDLVFAVSVGDVPVELHRLGLLCRDALELAITDACRSATPAGGLPACDTLHT
jgi:L-aminopeptidase/D-esterase-like protein